MSEQFHRYRYLMGAMQQNMLTTTVRMMCVNEDIARVEEFTDAWQAASTLMSDLAETEAFLPDKIIIEEPPASIKSRLDVIKQDSLFKSTFSSMPISIKVIDTDYLVAPQREVNLDYVDTISKRIPGSTIESLVEFCIGPRSQPPEMNSLQTAMNQITYSSKSLDLRFLSGAPKKITEDDISVAYGGGQPVEVATLLVGFGAAPINVFMAGKRVVLNNGFHRIVALKLAGITKIPVVVQHVTNHDIEFPEQILGLSRKYLLEQPRPVLLKDFFNDKLILELRLKPRRKTVTVTWQAEDRIVPE